jgi:hypothetical protein
VTRTGDEDVIWNGAVTDRIAMRKRLHNPIVALLASVTLACSIVGVSRAESPPKTEYQVKAAFLFNFTKFTDGGRFGPAGGQDGAKVDPNQPVVVGVVGKIPSKEGFEELMGKEVKGRPIVVRPFKGFEELKDSEGNAPPQHPRIEEIRKCHALFICPSEKRFLSRILPHLRNAPVLIVGDVPGFLQEGGTINFVIEDKKVRFEINLAAAARAKLQMRSSLLRLAVRVIEHDGLEEPNGKRN